MTTDLGAPGFPPRPRSWRELIESVVHGLAGTPSTAHWQPVHLKGLTAAWVGVDCPELGVLGRPWVWDVVTSADHDSHPELRHDPLALVVEQDMVVVALRRDDDASPLLQLQVPVDRVPEQVDIPASAMPEPPWRLELSTGWSTTAIGRVLDGWMADHVGRDRVVRPLHEAHAEAEDDRFAVGEGLWASTSAFDVLLEQDHGQAATFTRCLGAVAEALEPWRRHAA